MKNSPVAVLTIIITVLTALDGALTGTGVLSPTLAAWAGGVIAVLTTILGVITHGNVTPVANPKDNSGRALVPLNK